MSTIEQERAPLLTVVDVARLFGCSLVTVYRWERAGRLRGIRPSPGMLRFAPEDIDALIANGQREEHSGRPAA
jgi:excisionase family DNA binding protein